MAVTEASQPSAARFLTRDMAETAGFGEEDTYRAGLVATELATNLVKHAQGGEFLARVTATRPSGEIEIIALDRGPGMRDVAACFVDGHSTAGSSGTGLGAARRLSDTFDVFSNERGTIVFARVRAQRRSTVPLPLTVAAISLPMPGERVCGDAWTVRHDANGTFALVADGLGHGLHAAEAAGAAVTTFGARVYPTNANALQAVHDGLRHTRGAAAAIATVRRDVQVMTYAGVGNISTAVVHNGAVRQAVSHSGTLGHHSPPMREYSYPWSSESILVMHSDGLASHWSIDEYRGLRQRHPAVIAAALYRDHSRGRDDVTVLVGREM